MAWEFTNTSKWLGSYERVHKDGWSRAVVLFEEKLQNKNSVLNIKDSQEKIEDRVLGGKRDNSKKNVL